MRASRSLFKARGSVVRSAPQNGVPVGRRRFSQMSVNRWKLISMPVVMLGLASPLLVNCSGGLPGGFKPPGALGDAMDAAGGCDEMKDGDFAKITIKGGGAVEG